MTSWQSRRSGGAAKYNFTDFGQNHFGFSLNSRGTVTADESWVTIWCYDFFSLILWLIFRILAAAPALLLWLNGNCYDFRPGSLSQTDVLRKKSSNFDPSSAKKYTISQPDVLGKRSSSFDPSSANKSICFPELGPPIHTTGWSMNKISILARCWASASFWASRNAPNTIPTSIDLDRPRSTSIDLGRPRLKSYKTRPKFRNWAF